MYNYFDSPIFVLGLPRSGTSLITGSLSICGAWIGSTFPGDANNPEGFFEHITIRENVTKNILKQLLGCDPLGVRKLPPIKYEKSFKKINNLYKCKKIVLKNNFNFIY